MAKKQRTKKESHDQFDEELIDRVAAAERMIIATLVARANLAVHDDDLPIHQRAIDAVHEAAHELALAILIAEEEDAANHQQVLGGIAFQDMTDEDHEAMQAKLLKMANAGRPRPELDTIEGYCLAAYTDEEGMAVPVSSGGMERRMR
jgi:hypothetical protein